MLVGQPTDEVSPLYHLLLARNSLGPSDQLPMASPRRSSSIVACGDPVKRIVLGRCLLDLLIMSLKVFLPHRSTWSKVDRMGNVRSSSGFHSSFARFAGFPHSKDPMLPSLMSSDISRCLKEIVKLLNSQCMRWQGLNGNEKSDDDKNRRILADTLFKTSFHLVVTRRLAMMTEQPSSIRDHSPHFRLSETDARISLPVN
jgi:hypothetical protein